MSAALAEEQTLEKIKDYELTMQRSANEQGVLFGGVSHRDIAEALRAEGFAVDDRAVRIGEQIKRLDVYEIPIVLANDLKTHVKLWIVSDKPVDELGEGEAAPTGEQAAADETAPSSEAAAAS